MSVNFDPFPINAEAFIVPLTSNFWVGAVVPIPTFPSGIA